MALLGHEKQKYKKKKKKNLKNTQKWAFQLSAMFFGWGSKIPFFDNLAKKARTQKTQQKWGFQQSVFEKQMRVTKRPFLDSKNPKPEIPVIMFFLLLVCLEQKTQNLLKPQFF